jgi:hypothetical protein
VEKGFAKVPFEREKQKSKRDLKKLCKNPELKQNIALKKN